MLNHLTQAKPKHPPTLMSVLDFKLSDLNANRNGALSKRQLHIAESGQPNLLIQMVLMGHVVAIIGILIVIVFVSGVTAERLLFLGVASMVIVSPFLYAMDRISAMKKSSLSPEDVASGEVLSVCGLVECHPAPIPTQPARIRIDDKSFKVPNALLDLINSEKPYCAYYTTHTKRIISLEVLHE